MFVFPCLPVEISAWIVHPRPAADITQPQELPRTRTAGSLVSLFGATFKPLSGADDNELQKVPDTSGSPAIIWKHNKLGTTTLLGNCVFYNHKLKGVKGNKRVNH